MFAVFQFARKRVQTLLFLAALPVLAACDVGNFSGGPSLNTNRPVPVALLVPTSAPDGGLALAQSFENAARLAAADLGTVAIDLRVYDTGGQAEFAAAAATQAAQEGAKVIVGPLFAESANAAGLAVAARGLPVLSFSNNPAIAGGNVFILGSTFQNTADRLVSYAVGNGRGNILIAQGRSTAEQSGAEAITRAIANQGARLAGISSFDLTQQAVIEAIPQIAADVETSGADVLFMTSGNDGAVPFLADLLPENGVDPLTTQFVGLQRLDVPASALSLGGLQGAWFAAPDPVLADQFRIRYTDAFGSAPHPLASLAYDGVAAVGALAATGDSNALGIDSITRPSGFAGVNGVFRFLPNGVNQRGLAVAQIQNNQVVILDPAPRSFGVPGL